MYIDFPFPDSSNGIFLMIIHEVSEFLFVIFEFQKKFFLSNLIRTIRVKKTMRSGLFTEYMKLTLCCYVFMYLQIDSVPQGVLYL